jgi:hypothetical protein
MAMQYVETTLSDATIRMRYADDPDPTKAVEWIEFRLKIADLQHPSGRGKLGKLELQYLGEAHRAALRYVRDVIGDETRRLADQASHTP